MSRPRRDAPPPADDANRAGHRVLAVDAPPPPVDANRAGDRVLAVDAPPPADDANRAGDRVLAVDAPPPADDANRAGDRVLARDAPPSPATDAAAREAAFLRAVHAANPEDFAAARAALAPALTPGSAARLAVYRDGFYARVTQTLAGTVFERAAALFGVPYVEGLIGAFLTAHPPASSVMAAAVAGLPATVADAHVRGILELGLARWRVLIDADPGPPAALTDPEQIRLAPNHAFITSAAPIFTLWTRDEGEVAARPEGVLLYKSSPIDLEMAHIDAALSPFTHALSEGRTLAAALPLVPDAAAPALAALVAHLAATRAFVTAPV